ncbi:mRNA splicing protein prp28 [Kappamyces sp. JEL0829]|nr:mRNA splicing protein prp28 [Kappamyces sp. JEL0829]
MSRVPLSIDELLVKRKAQEELEAKPVFLSKAERAKLALERRAAQVQEEKQQKNSAGRAVFSKSTGPSLGNGLDERSWKQGPKGTDQANMGKHGQDGKRDREADPAELVDSVKEKYLGVQNKEKRKIRKLNDKKFVFDWAQDEDTSQDHNPLYQTKHTSELLLKRKLGGMESIEKSSRGYLSLANPCSASRAETKIEKHWSSKKLPEMTERDWRIFKEDFNITIKGTNVPHPLRSWRESAIPTPILEVIQRVGYTDPTPIQRQAIPIAIQGRDMIGVAETGSGKTASFVIPMLCFIKDLPPLDMSNSHLGPYALVLAPTRELAIQIETEAQKFASAMGFICVSIVGGHSKESQTTSLLRGAHIIIATPGRLKDMIESRMIALAQCVYVVLDEADRMVDLGFEPDLNYILGSMPAGNMKPDSEQAENEDWLQDRLASGAKFRQTVMFSATMPPPVEKLAKEYLRRPVNVTVGLVGQVVDRIEQRVEMISDEAKKIARMQKIFSSGEFDAPMIVFVNEKKTCDTVARALESIGYRCAVLHGGKGQDQREAALAGLKAGTREVMVATDVAGRGIDVKNVSLVLNFDMAKSIEDYTHRIGRTGRAGSSGCAITFLASKDTGVYYDLKIVLQKSPLSKVPRELATHEAAMQKPSAAHAAAIQALKDAEAEKSKKHLPSRLR